MNAQEYANEMGWTYEGDTFEAGVSFSEFTTQDGTTRFLYNKFGEVLEVPLEEVGSSGNLTWAVKVGETVQRMVDDEEPFIHDDVSTY